MDFRAFGPDHWGVLIFTLGAGLGLALGARRIRSLPDDRLVRYPAAILLLTNELASWIFYWIQGITLLPLQLCDWAFLLIVCSLLRGGRWVAELAFFWGLGASSQAILTPDLREAFPSYPWLAFFVSHCGVVLSAVYLLARGFVKLTSGSVWRVWLYTNFYVAIAGGINWRFGTNFGYLARKPEHSSLLDYLGPWPYYILWGEFIALGIFFLCDAFGRRVERFIKDDGSS